jgi:myosin heavy subunit
MKKKHSCSPAKTDPLGIGRTVLSHPDTCLNLRHSFVSRCRNCVCESLGIFPTISSNERRRKMVRDVNDLADLSSLDISSIMDTLRRRFDVGQPYTLCRGVCISINPHQWLPLYTTQMRKTYMDEETADAHPYLLAARALRSVYINQAHTLVITGDSGSGKTEAVRICLEFTSTCSTRTGEARIQRILRTGELLEYMGNAQTANNANSSRFGKHLALYFRGREQVGARLQTFLLERGRVCPSNPSDGTFRVVYAILDDPVLCNEFALHAVDRSVLGNPQAASPSTWSRFRELARHVGFSEAQCSDMAESVVGGLFLRIRDYANASRVLGVDVGTLTRTMTHRRIATRDDEVWTPCSAAEVRQRCRGLAASLYSRMFDGVVRELNGYIGGTTTNTALSFLDIFGFESLETNRLDQLCINYCNERMQALFVEDMVLKQQLEYAEEGIAHEHIEFDADTRVVELCEVVLFPSLDEAVRLRSTPKELVDRLRAEQSRALDVPLVSSDRPTFAVEHYAGRVTYDASRFVERNADHVRPEFAEMLAAASRPGTAALFGAKNDAPLADRRLWSKSVATAFAEQMRALLSAITSTSVAYIRCVRPNASKAPDHFDDLDVRAQVAASGILHACRVMREGYEHRVPHSAFRRRFPHAWARRNDLSSSQEVHYGRAAVFMSARALTRLRRAEAACAVQRAWRRAWRRACTRKRRVEAACAAQRAWRRACTRKRRAEAACVVQRVWRRACTRKRRVEAASAVQCAWRRERRTKKVCKRRRPRCPSPALERPFARTKAAATLIQRRVRVHNTIVFQRWRDMDELGRLRVRVMELRDQIRAKDALLFRATVALRRAATQF